MRFIDKLRERKVVQWTAGYFAVAWGLLEVLGFLANQFDWAPVIVRGATVLLGTGLFITMILAWNHGDRGHQRATPGELLLLVLVVSAGATLTFVLAPDDSNDQSISAGPVTRLTIGLDRDQRLAVRGAYSYPLAISPDGSGIAYVSVIDGRAQLALRALDSFETRILPGTEGAAHPFFSPDGRWVGFFANRTLYKVSVAGGSPVAITETDAQSLGASWGPNDRILYALISRGLRIVPAGGGDAAEINIRFNAPEKDEPGNVASQVTEGSIAWPSILPDGKHAIVSDRVGTMVISIDSGAARRLVRSNDQSRYARSGHLLFTETGEKLLAVRFDLDTLSVTGSTFSVLDGAFRAPGGGAMLFDISANGTLAYVTGGFERSLHLTDRFGRGEPLTDDKRGFRFPRFSPEGDRVAVIVDPRPSNLWVYDVARGTGEPLTTDGHNLLPIWSSGSDRIFFSRNGHLFSIDPADDQSLVQVSPEDNWTTMYSHSITSDSRVVYGNRRTDENLWDIFALHLGDTPTQTPRVATPGNDVLGKVSPNDRWLAFASDFTGRREIYVEPRDGSGQRLRVSVDGGSDPTWSSDGTELFFRYGNRIMVTTITEEPALSISEPELLFVAPDLDTTQERNWDAGPDDRFVLVQSDPATTSEFQVVLNWFSVLQEQTGN